MRRVYEAKWKRECGTEDGKMEEETAVAS